MKSIAVMIIFAAVLVGGPAFWGHASERVGADLFSASPAAMIPETNAGSVQAVSGHRAPAKADETLQFLSHKALENASPAKALARKTAIHFLTGVDVDQIAATSTLEQQLSGVAIPVSVLVFEKCTHTGSAENGTSECEWRYSSGFKSTLTSQHTDDGKKKVSLFVLTESDREGTWQGQRKVLHTTIMEGGKIASESYDITYDLGLSPGTAAKPEKARTREVLLYHYDPQAEGKQFKDMSWTKYADTRDQTPREMEYHAVLTYDENGQPRRGRASKWVSGWKSNTLFDWQSEKDVPDLSAREQWQMWEQWIKNGPAHVFIV